jgi:hypothetical protein
MIGNQLPSNHWFINDDDGGVPTMMNRHNEHFIDIGDMINRARITVRKYYSNPFWCKLYTKTKINVTFKNMYQTLLDIQSKAMKQRKVIDADNKIIAKLLKTKGQEEAMIKAKEQYDMQFSVQRKLLKTLYVVFDEVEAITVKGSTSSPAPCPGKKLSAIPIAINGKQTTVVSKDVTTPKEESA